MTDGSKGKLAQAEAFWLDNTAEENYELESFEEPISLRRLSAIPTSLASLTFGQFRDLQGRSQKCELVVWINYITSERAGDGSRLIRFLKSMAREHELALGALPQPLRPKIWEDGRRYFHRQEEVIDWYCRQGFDELKFGFGRQIWYLPTSLSAKIDLAISLKSAPLDPTT